MPGLAFRSMKTLRGLAMTTVIGVQTNPIWFGHPIPAKAA